MTSAAPAITAAQDTAVRKDRLKLRQLSDRQKSRQPSHSRSSWLAWFMQAMRIHRQRSRGTGRFATASSSSSAPSKRQP
jgi:hypothetical protein